jgi:hypothetical protein
MMHDEVAGLAAGLVSQAAARAADLPRVSLEASALVAATLVEAVAAALNVAGFVSAHNAATSESIADLLAALTNADWGVGPLSVHLSVSARGALECAALSLDVALAHAPADAGAAAPGGDAEGAGGGSAAE